MEEKTNHHGDAAVMVHMQEGHLTVGLSENEDKGVQELPVFLNVEHVEHLHNLLRSLVSKVNVTAIEGFTSQVIITEHSDEAICSKTDADEVVDNHKLLRVESFFSLVHILHEHKDCHEIEDISNQHGFQISERKAIHIFFYTLHHSEITNQFRYWQLLTGHRFQTSYYLV